MQVSLAIVLGSATIVNVAYFNFYAYMHEVRIDLTRQV